MYVITFKRTSNNNKATCDFRLIPEDAELSNSRKISKTKPSVVLSEVLEELTGNACVDELHMYSVDASVVFALPLTLREYAEIYPNRISKTTLRHLPLADMTVASFLCNNHESLYRLPGIGEKTVNTIVSILCAGCGLQAMPGLNPCNLLGACLELIPKLKDNYRSTYDSYRQAKQRNSDDACHTGHDAPAEVGTI